MMKPRLFFLTVSLAAVLIISSCASAETSTPAVSAVESIPVTAASANSSPPTLAPTPIVDVQVAPTSRGPNLEATDPATVALASGQLQLVEFFRFT